MIVASRPIKSVPCQNPRQDAARSRYPVLAVKESWQTWHTNAARHYSDRYSRGYQTLLSSGVPFCSCCFERANISGISDNDELYVPRNVANPGAPYPSPGSSLVEQTRAHHDGFFGRGEVCVYLASQFLVRKELAFRKEYRSSA